MVERLSGQTFGEFLRTRIFAPLGMVDTGFYVPADQVHRLTAMYSGDGKGGLKVATEAFDMPINDYTRPPRFEGGGGGLVSTAIDYARFCQMILNKGELDGVRIVSSARIDLMATNVIPDAVLNTANPLRLLPFNPAFGFGLDFAVVIDPPSARCGRRQGHVELGRGRRNLVLDRSRERPDLRRHDSNGWLIRSAASSAPGRAPSPTPP